MVKQSTHGVSETRLLLHLHQPRGPEMKMSVEATQDIQADIRRLDAAIDWAERAWGRIRRRQVTGGQWSHGA